MHLRLAIQQLIATEPKSTYLIPFDAVKLAAEDIRNLFKKIGLISFPRLSGGKGVNVVVPITHGS